MNTHDILLTVQYITISVLFVEIMIVFLRWKNPIHSYLFLTCISSFISNMGYLFQMKAGSEEAYITALKFSYAGRVWIVFAYFLFSARMCRIRIPKGLIAFLTAVHIGIYIVIASLESNTLYYNYYDFSLKSGFPVFSHGNGIVHDLLMGLNVVLIIFAMAWVIRAFRMERNRTPKLRLLMLILAFGVQAISFMLQTTAILGISKRYDLTMSGALFGTIFMLIGIFGFDLLGTREIARDFVIDRISEGIIAVDHDGRIQYFNEPVAKLFPEFAAFYSMKTGLREKRKHTEDKDHIGDDKAHIYTPYDIISKIDRAISTGETIKIDDRIYTPEENDLQHRGVSYGKLYALVDDTEHYRYMEELQKQKDIADNANEAKSRFLANMSHEIRTPINAVLGMDEMILRESKEKSIRAYAFDIMSAGRTLLSLINDILDFSKVEEGKMEIIPVQYDLSSLINDLVNMIRDRATKKGLKLNVVVDENIPHLLFGDEIRIRQCVMNILTNAVKYTEKGEVTLSVSSAKTDQSHILLGFCVKDTGIGMRAEDMEALFSPYKRLEEKRNRTIEGTGLGMSITRQLLDLMGSELKVISEYGKGSEFSFEIDQKVLNWEKIGDFAVRFNDLSDRSYEYHELFHAPDARILVVDDTEMNLTVIKSLLKMTGIKIDTAMSGRDALKLTDVTSYDVIFIDHMMADMDGIETLKAIRGSGANMDTPAVALTANAVSGAREMYLDAGFTDYLSKPVDGGKLEKMLCDMIPAEKIKAPEDKTGDSIDDNPDDPDDISVDLSILDMIEEIDKQAGYKNCGSKEGYISVLSVFAQTSAYKADEIEDMYKSGDIAGYTIKVHALKSSARIIGASELSELAYKLEDAGKRNDLAFIQANTNSLLGMYRTLGGKLSFLKGSDDDLPAIDESALREAYQTIVEIAGSMDYELMEGILKELNGYRLPGPDRERVSKIERMLTELDWDGIIQIAQDN